ncbi:unnamed protein product [Prunus armeniaca]
MGVDDFFNPHGGSTTDSFSHSRPTIAELNAQMAQLLQMQTFGPESDPESGFYFDDSETDPKSGSYFDDPEPNSDYDDDDLDLDSEDDLDPHSNDDPDPEFV